MLQHLIKLVHYPFVRHSIVLYTCRDCFWETEAYCSILTYDRHVPPEIRKKFNKVYRSEFYFTHLSPWGLRARVRKF